MGFRAGCFLLADLGARDCPVAGGRLCWEDGMAVFDVRRCLRAEREKELCGRIQRRWETETPECLHNLKEKRNMVETVQRVSVYRSVIGVKLQKNQFLDTSLHCRNGKG